MQNLGRHGSNRTQIVAYSIKTTKQKKLQADQEVRTGAKAGRAQSGRGERIGKGGMKQKRIRRLWQAFIY